MDMTDKRHTRELMWTSLYLFMNIYMYMYIYVIVIGNGKMILIDQSKAKNHSMHLKKNEEGYMRSFGRRKQKEEMI